MKFAQFLLTENDDDTTKPTTVGDIIDIVDKKIADKAKDIDVFIDNDLYVIDYVKKDEEFTAKELLGYFIYKKDANEGDDFFIGKYIYRVTKDDVDILTDDVKGSFTTIADADLHIKNKLKGTTLK